MIAAAGPAIHWQWYFAAKGRSRLQSNDTAAAGESPFNLKLTQENVEEIGTEPQLLSDPVNLLKDYNVLSAK